MMFHHLGEQISHLCYLPKDTEILYHVGNKTPTLNSRHCVPVSAETGPLLFVSKQKSCPPRIYVLPSSKRRECSSGSITAALAASKGPTQAQRLRRCSFQPCRDRTGVRARALEAQRKQPPEALGVIRSGNSLSVKCQCSQGKIHDSLTVLIKLAHA